MSRKRWTLTAVALASLGCAGLVAVALWPDAPGVTRSSFARIELGMTRAECEAILGGPPCKTAPNGRTWVLFF